MPKRILSLKSTGGPQSITSITCGVSSPKLGGEIYLNSFPNLTSFTCTNNNITGLYGTSNLSSLKTLDISLNKLPIFPDLNSSTGLETLICYGESASVKQFTGLFPNFAINTKLKKYDGIYCEFSGTLPSLTTNTSLEYFNCAFNSLSGNLPNLSSNTNLNLFYCYRNNFNGSIPNLSANTKLDVFLCQVNSLSGSIPVIPAVTRFFNCRINALTGSIPSLSTNTSLVEYDCGYNQLSGIIPSLSSNINLEAFSCAGNTNISGNIPSLSANTRLRRFYCLSSNISGFASGTVSNTLGDFQAQTCKLTQSAVDSILATFVAAGRTSGNANTITPGFTTCSINLAGAGNTSPTSGQNNPNRLILVNQRGWQVTVN